MKFNFDVDIDLADRNLLLQHIKHTPAAMHNVNPARKHNTGIHITDIPYDAVNNMASLDYKVAEQRGYFKLDLLNVHLYSKVRSEEHLIQLMEEPDWNMLNERSIVEQLIHIGNHYDSLQRMPEPVNSVPRLAMFLSVIRPSKKHLIGKPWSEVAKTVWESDGEGYQFKRSHSIAYSHLVVVNMNLFSESGHSTNQCNATTFNSTLV